MRAEAARFALVVWADAETPTEHNRAYPCCITLDAVDAALARGAVLVGREFEIVDDGIQVVHTDEEIDQA